MTDTTIERPADDRQGGASVWSPSVMPPIGVDLTDEATLACAFRILAREGFAENMAGHITWQRPGHEELLVNPWGLWWAEVAASDVCTVDTDANVVAGKWDVTPAIHIHTELHRVRSDARVVIHNHPYHVCVLAAAGLLPDLVHQQASLYLNDIRMVNEYTGEIDSADLGADLAQRIGDANTVILANHGVIITGATMEEAVYRATGIDRACRMAFDVWQLQAMGHQQLKMQPGMMKGMQASQLERAAEVYWAGAVRQLIRDEPEVLELMLDFDDLTSDLSFTKAKTGADRTVTFLPEPERAERKYTVISVDDHIVEPPDAFEGRVPAKFADRAPRVVTKDDGRQTWVFDGMELPNVGFNAVVGRPVDEYTFEPTNFDEMRRGSWDIHARIKDMDVNGVYASVNFPSFLPGFAGQRMQTVTKDLDLAMASIRAWNDWHLEGWAGPYPDRIIPMQLPWYHDPEVGAKMIYENAERGFKAVSFCEAPDKLGFPTLHTGYWDPMMRACAETGTVVNLHIGSSGASPSTTPDAPPDVPGVLFFAYAIFAAVDWLYSLIPVRFPDLKICLSEGGIGWVPGLLDRLDHMESYHDMYGTWTDELTPAEVMTRNFWYCAVEDQSTFALRQRIGIENILLESDYPHCDSTWPHTQSTIEEEIGGLPADDIRKITWENASNLHRHPVPEAIQRDPNAF